METAIEKLMNAMDGICDCAIINDTVNRHYFTGMKSSDGTLVVFKDMAYLIIDFRYIEKAKKTAKGCQVILQDRLYHQINELIKKHNAITASVNSEFCTLEQFTSFKSALKVKLQSDSKLMNAIKKIRMVKTQSEIDKIISAQRIAEKGFMHMLEFIHAGLTERGVQLELDYFMLKNGAEDLSFDTIAISGKNTSLPHGVPTDKVIENGDFFLMDFGAVVDGYHSDMTRTICVGKPTEKMQEVYSVVLEAQLAGIKAVKAGIDGNELDRISRDIIDKAGYKDNFGHSLGHGVGMEIHEAPVASPRQNIILPLNSIITIEPGIYIENEFGVRIEDFVVVKKDGCINMTEAPKELICI